MSCILAFHCQNAILMLTEIILNIYLNVLYQSALRHQHIV